MKRSYVIVGAVIVVLAAGYWLWQRGRGERAAIDLLTAYANLPADAKRSNVQPIENAFSVSDVTIKGETKKALFMHPTSRLTYSKVLVPDDARLQVWIAVKEEAWDKQGDGVLFRFGVSDGREYEELLNQHVNPAGNPNDRRWIPVDIDLSAYAGQPFDLIFNTNSSPPGPGGNNMYDFAVWGAPALVVRH